MTRYLMRVDIFEVDDLEVNISALPQIGSLAYQYCFSFTTRKLSLWFFNYCVIFIYF